MSTIYALSTVFGKSGVAVIRISGPAAREVIASMTDLAPAAIEPRHAYFIKLYQPRIPATDSGHVLDHALLLFFPSPHSFTGEDIVELHLHGSKAVIKSVLDSLSQLPDFRLAEPGEFSKRAFYNHKMDLTEAEGLADLIDSETAEQQKYALRQMEGSLKTLYDNWRQQIIEVLSYLEAYIDFPEENIPESLKSNILNTVFKLKNEILEHLSSDNIGERLRDGFKVVIIGAPNVGKSSLLNAIAKREAVIVSDIAGTTRDAIDIHLDIKGYPIIFTDTAGLHETEEEIEKKGIEIALSKTETADLVLVLYDATTCHSGESRNPEVNQIENRFKNNVLYVANKCDLLTDKRHSREAGIQPNKIIYISAKNQTGIDELLDSIHRIIKEKFTSSSGLIISRHRYQEALKNTLKHLNNFNINNELELATEDIRLAARDLGKITGKIEVDDILNKIFSDFCIGK